MPQPKNARKPQLPQASLVLRDKLLRNAKIPDSVKRNWPLTADQLAEGLGDWAKNTPGSWVPDADGLYSFHTDAELKAMGGYGLDRQIADLSSENLRIRNHTTSTTPQAGEFSAPDNSILKAASVAGYATPAAPVFAAADISKALDDYANGNLSKGEAIGQIALASIPGGGSAESGLKAGASALRSKGARKFLGGIGERLLGAVKGAKAGFKEAGKAGRVVEEVAQTAGKAARVAPEVAQVAKEAGPAAGAGKGFFGSIKEHPVASGLVGLGFGLPVMLTGQKVADEYLIEGPRRREERAHAMDLKRDEDAKVERVAEMTHADRMGADAVAHRKLLNEYRLKAALAADENRLNQEQEYRRHLYGTLGSGDLLQAIMAVRPPPSSNTAVDTLQRTLGQ